MTESLYRKYRPQTFADVVGQDPIERTLRNALAQNKVSHAYLFTGPRGTGKTTTARLMAKALMCEHGPTPDPDGSCEACQMIADGVHPDVYELDAASRTGVENVREEIIGRVHFAPTVGRAKVYIIDEVHMLSTAAFNALLKTLEEPPDHVVFILCTTDPQKVPATIHSRCQRFDFHRISADEIVSRLGAVCVSEGVDFEPEALALIADRSDGGMRNALTTLEQLMVFCDGHVTLAGAEDLLGALASSDMAEIVQAIGRRDAAACFAWVARYVETGADLAQFVEDFAARVRTLYVLSVAGDDAPVEVAESERPHLSEELRLFGPERLARLLGIVGDLMSELRASRNPRLAFEIALTRMVHPGSDLTVEALAERVEELERRLAALTASGGVSGAAGRTPEGAVPAAAAFAADTPPAAAGGRPAAPAAGAAAYAEAVAPGAAAPVSAPAAAPAPVGAPAARGGAAPAPAPSPAATAAASSADSGNDELARILANPAALQRNWRSATDLLKQVKAAYGVLFMNTDVAPAATGDAIVVTFSAANTFAYNTARKPDVYDELQKAITQVFGRPVTVQFAQEGGAPVAVPPAMAAAPAQASAPSPAPAMPVTSVTPAAPAPAMRQTTQQPASPAYAPQPAPQPSRAPQPAPAPRPAPAPAPIPQPAPAAYDEPGGAYDEVPVDAYGDYTDDGYDDAPFAPPTPPRPIGAPAPRAQNAAPAGTPAFRPNAPAASAPEPEPFIPPTAPAARPANPPAAPAPDGEADGASISDILAAGFGSDAYFEEA